jgi:hypothetical protein
MSDKSLPKFKYALVCDDIREEIGGKVTLVGVYSTKIIVPKVPGHFPKLCLRICFDAKKPFPDAVHLSIRHVNGKVLMGGAVPTPKPIGENEGYINLTVTPFVVDAAGEYELVASNGGKEIVILRFDIQVNPLSN